MRVLPILCLLVAAPAAAAPLLVESKPCPADYAGYERGFLAEQKQILAAQDAQLTSAQGPARETLVKGRAEIAGWKPIPRKEFDAVLGGKELTCRRVVYLSDGLKVVAYTLAKGGGGKRPVMFWLRGGNGDFGRVQPSTLVGPLAGYARAGYLVVAPQYRGVDGGEGQDEFGGAEIADVMALPALAKELPEADADKLFLFGVSRGGMMAYLALRKGLAVRAAAVHAGMADAVETIQARPEMEDTFRRRVPDYEQRKADALRERSAVAWASEITVPLLLLHGTADWRVDVSHAYAVAAKLQAAKREYAVVIFAGDDHGLAKNRDEARRQVLRWFAAHGGVSQ